MPFNSLARRSGILAVQNHTSAEIFFSVLIFYGIAATVVNASDQNSRLLAPQAPPPAAGVELHYAIREELPVGSPITDIVADAGLHVHGIDAVRSFRFRLLNQQQYPVSSSSSSGVIGVGGGSSAVVGGGVFVVGETTGMVRVGSRLDRESICSGPTSTSTDQSWRCIVRLDIAVQPMTFFQIIKVRTYPLGLYGSFSAPILTVRSTDATN